MMRPVCVLACVLILSSCSGHSSTGGVISSSVGASPPPAAYLPRIGIAVITGSRTCVAIQNANLAVSGPVTLVSPTPLQTFAQAQVSALSQTPCPISKEVDPNVSNYDLDVPRGVNLPKLTPLIAILGTSATLSAGTNGNIHADLDQNGKTESFRACNVGDGVHLTVWSGNALDGTVLWLGSYYEPASAGAGPACSPKELNGG